MKFAIIDNIKTEAFKGAKGVCPNCGSELIAKCGTVKVNHWAHKGVRNCDPWWENETEWHRNWKSHFKNDWQEIVLRDELTGEKHIADIRTTHELVVEFQHSHIDPVERNKREQFYKKMIWIVDGARLQRDYPRFLKGHKEFRRTNRHGFFLVDFPNECFPSAWLNSSVPVIFDFKGMEVIDDGQDLRNYLYLLFPSTQMDAIVAIISREYLISKIIDGEIFEKKQEPQKQTISPPVQTTALRFPRQPQYILHKGRFVKKRRF